MPMDALDIFCEVIELPEVERDSAIARLCDGEAEIRQEVEELFRNHDSPATLVRTQAHHAGLSQLLADDVNSDDGIVPAKATGQLRATVITMLGLAVLGLSTWAVVALQSHQAQTARTDTAMAEARRLLTLDPAGAKRQLARVPTSNRGNAWQVMQAQIDPVVAIYRCSKQTDDSEVEGDVAFLSDGTACAVFATGNRARLIDVVTGKTIAECVAPGVVRAPCIDAAARTLSAWSPDQSSAASLVLLWDLTSGTQLKTYSLATTAIDGFRFGQGDSTLVWTHRNLTHKLDISTGTQATLSRHSMSRQLLVTSPTSRWSVALNSDGSVRLWDSGNAAEKLLGKHDGQVRAAVFSANERWLATSGTDQCIRIWSVAETQPVQVVARTATHLSLSNDGSLLLAFGKGEAALLQLGDDHR